MYPLIFWGDLLKELREQHFMLQKDVADLLHISRQSYSNLECGRAQPTAEQIAALSFVYEMNLLEYVQKCLPARFVAEQSAYRDYQSRRMHTMLLEKEEEEKRLRAARERKKEREEMKKQGPPFSSFEEDPDSLSPKPKEKGKRKTAKQYHNTTGLSPVDLLRSSRYPKPAGKRKRAKPKPAPPASSEDESEPSGPPVRNPEAREDVPYPGLRAMLQVQAADSREEIIQADPPVNENRPETFPAGQPMTGDCSEVFPADPPATGDCPEVLPEAPSPSEDYPDLDTLLEESSPHLSDQDFLP